jgi:thiol-disulfide isomerase/thioredoxin
MFGSDSVQSAAQRSRHVARRPADPRRSKRIVDDQVTARPRAATHWVFFVALLCAAGATSLAVADTPGEVQVGQRLREATIQGLNGPSRRLSEFRGKPLIINVWASWCGPCREEMASLERLAWLDPSAQFTVIGISTDDYADQARAWLEHSNATINQFIDSRLVMENMLGASRLPLTVFVDADGKVLAKVYGSRQWDAPEALQLIRDTFRIRAGTPPSAKR